MASNGSSVHNAVMAIVANKVSFTGGTNLSGFHRLKTGLFSKAVALVQ